MRWDICVHCTWTSVSSSKLESVNGCDIHPSCNEVNQNWIIKRCEMNIMHAGGELRRQAVKAELLVEVQITCAMHFLSAMQHEAALSCLQTARIP